MAWGGNMLSLYVRFLARGSPVLVWIVPVAMAVFAVVGLSSYEIEDRLFKLWVKESSHLSKNEEYLSDVLQSTGQSGAGSSQMLATAKPRSSGNALTADMLLELRDRLVQVEAATVMVDGHQFYFQDVCTNLASAYLLPCFRMTVLDCFAEGEYSFDAVAQATWKQLTITTVISSLREPLTKTGIMGSSAMCQSSCNNDGAAQVVAQLLGAPAGTWEQDPTCSACMSAAMAASSTATLDAIYYQVLGGMIPTMQNPAPTDAQLMAKYSVSSREEAYDAFLLEVVTTTLSARMLGKTPYTYDPATGASRTHLRDPVTGAKATDAQVLNVASATCHNWNTLLPANNPILVYGEPSPSDFSSTNVLVEVKAVQNIILLDRPDSIRSRVALAARGQRFSEGSISISDDTAEKVLLEFKKKLEEVYTKDWNTNSGLLQFTAFTDDAAVHGTFARAFSQMSDDVSELTIWYAVAIFSVTAILFTIPFDGVETRTGLAVMGTLFAALAVAGALGFSSICGMRLTIVHFWCLPFLLLGVGIDDMFIISIAAQNAQGSTAIAKLEATMSQVAAPITLTSIINLAMFVVMSASTDLGALKLAGYTGIMGVGMAYLTMMTSFPILAYLDNIRRDSQRMDVACCIRRKSGKSNADTTRIDGPIFRYLYKPLITNIILRGLVLLAALAVVTIAAVYIKDTSIGLDLQDFFPGDSQPSLWANTRAEFFPNWNVQLNWGQLEYESPDIQMKMLRQWEGMLSTSHIAGEGIPSGLVWTAALASWMLPCSAGQTCGPSLNSTCAATLAPNTLGLKLVSDGGVCVPGSALTPAQTGSFCPVIQGLTQQELALCFKLWSTSASATYSAVGPSIYTLPDGTPAVPIRYSVASGSSLFATKLYKGKDYVDLIRETRTHVDDTSPGVGRSWMGGIPYDYWEQYLDIVKYMVSIGASALAFGFAISWLFVFLELHVHRRGTVVQRLVAASTGSVLVAVMGTASMVTVFGWSCIFGIQLNGFTAMAVLLSLGLSVEYSVHVVHGFIESTEHSAVDRIGAVMKGLFWPTLAGFLTTFVSVLMLVFADAEFVRLYYFAPLAIATVCTYFYGILVLPAALSFMSFLQTLSLDSQKSEGVAPSDLSESIDSASSCSQSKDIVQVQV